MFDLAGTLGKNAGWKELLSSKDAPQRLKSVIQALQYANANIESREISAGYADSDLGSGEVFMQSVTAKNSLSALEAGMVWTTDQGCVHPEEVGPCEGCA